jgi:hypothetical protein
MSLLNVFNSPEDEIETVAIHKFMPTTLTIRSYR